MGDHTEEINQTVQSLARNGINADFLPAERFTGRRAATSSMLPRLTLLPAIAASYDKGSFLLRFAGSDGK